MIQPTLRDLAGGHGGNPFTSQNRDGDDTPFIRPWRRGGLRSLARSPAAEVQAGLAGDIRRGGEPAASSRSRSCCRTSNPAG